MQAEDLEKWHRPCLCSASVDRTSACFTCFFDWASPQKLWNYSRLETVRQAKCNLDSGPAVQGMNENGEVVIQASACCPEATALRSWGKSDAKMRDSGGADNDRFLCSSAASSDPTEHAISSKFYIFRRGHRFELAAQSESDSGQKGTNTGKPERNSGRCHRRSHCWRTGRNNA